MIARALDAEVTVRVNGAPRGALITATAACPILVRRNDTTPVLAYYHCYSPRSVPLRTLVRVAGQRRTIEESFETTKGLTDPDQHQVHTRTSWHPWTILVMLAHAFLAIITTRSA